MDESSRTRVHSVDKAMHLLEILLDRRAPMSLNELSQVSGYPKSTVHALLATMREHDAVTQQHNGRYELGLKLFELGSAVSAGWDITRTARPYLERLAEQTGASSFLSVLNGDNVMSIDQCAGVSSFHVVPETGIRLPLHATSQGKLLLSRLTKDDVRSRVNLAGMQAFTPHTRTDLKLLLSELDQIRAQGYAIEDGEYRVGLRSVSALVRSNTGQCFALGVVGLFHRPKSEEFKNIVGCVTLAAKQLTETLSGDDS